MKLYFFFVLCLIHVFASLSDDQPENSLSAIHPEKTIFKIDPNVLVDVSSYSFSGCNAYIQVNVSGVTTPGQFDYLGLYLASENVTTLVPIKYSYTSNDPGYLANGIASLNFELLNLREDLIWYFFQNVSNQIILTASTKSISFTNYNEACFGRLALTSNLNEMRLTWNTKDTNMPFVKYGLASGQYSATVNAASSTYTASMLCGSPANSTGFRSPGQIHTAVLTGLRPNTTYYYQYGDTYGVSTEYSFVSAPIVNANLEFTFVIFGDMGASDNDGSSQWKSTDNAAPTVAAAVAKETDSNLAILIGDISYADGYLSKWDSYHSQIRDVTSRSPLMVSQGNHDRDFPDTDTTYTGPDSGGECGVVIESQIPMPLVSKVEPWWSFNYGSIHFVVMNTEVNFTTGSAQYNWIVSDLSSVDRQATPYVVFTGHRPMYCDSNENYTTRGGNGNLNVQAELQLHIEPLFQKYQVPVALWGHSHNYQRTCTVFNKTCVADQSAGTTHFVIGIAGRKLDGPESLQTSQPNWISVLNYTTNGYIRATVNPKQLHMEYLAVSSNGETTVIDEYTLFAPSNLATKNRASLGYFPLVIFLLISIL